MIISGSFKHKLVTVSPTAAEEKPASPARVCREHMADGHLHPPSSGFFCVAGCKDTSLQAQLLWKLNQEDALSPEVSGLPG